MNDKTNYNEDFEALSLNEAISLMSELKLKSDALGDERAEINKKYDVLRMNIVPSKMEEAGEESKTISGIGRITLQADVFASIPAPMRDQAYEWLDEHGHGDIIKPTVNASTLKALIKSLIRKGTEIPESIFKVTPVTRAVITRKGVSDNDSN